MTIQEKLGKVIVQLRKKEGISQETLALNAGIDRKYMSDIENGKRNISIDIIERLSKFFNISISSLFLMVDEM